jgi:hypothetical protein
MKSITFNFCFIFDFLFCKICQMTWKNEESKRGLFGCCIAEDDVSAVRVLVI